MFGKRALVAAVMALVSIAAASASAATTAAPLSSPSLLLGGLGGGSGSTVGPHGDLYVPDPVAGKVLRVEGVRRHPRRRDLEDRARRRQAELRIRAQ
jgi:hypothetical protein